MLPEGAVRKEISSSRAGVGSTTRRVAWAAACPPLNRNRYAAGLEVIYGRPRLAALGKVIEVKMQEGKKAHVRCRFV